MFGILKGAAEAIVKAQAAEAELRKNMQKTIDRQHGTLGEYARQISDLRRENEALKMTQVSHYCTLDIETLPVWPELFPRVSKINPLVYAATVAYGNVNLCEVGQSPKKVKYVVDTGSMDFIRVRTVKGAVKARFDYGAAGHAMACQYVDFLNSLEK